MTIHHKSDVIFKRKTMSSPNQEVYQVSSAGKGVRGRGTRVAHLLVVFLGQRLGQRDKAAKRLPMTYIHQQRRMLVYSRDLQTIDLKTSMKSAWVAGTG
ncbi:hypothetical protein CEXT_735421 [Caerostris extrusa]|uniref:Uncharacterized protein n=1 Tax=Caerostris extrusa TaxID=172846 RepID=A0AAV4T5E0_CAEEX|nr:hypothetical protein CEXT_735421 [Caerostris extrusa]